MLFMMMRGICIAEAAPEAETPQQEPSVPVTEEPATSIPKPAPVADGAARDTPVREYLDTTVVPILRQGLRELVKARPANPFDFLADYIRDNKPK